MVSEEARVGGVIARSRRRPSSSRNAAAQCWSTCRCVGNETSGCWPFCPPGRPLRTMNVGFSDVRDPRRAVEHVRSRCSCLVSPSSVEALRHGDSAAARPHWPARVPRERPDARRSGGNIVGPSRLCRNGQPRTTGTSEWELPPGNPPEPTCTPLRAKSRLRAGRLPG